MDIIYELSNGELRSITIDATIRETHNKAAEVTEHAVEQGVNISDHVRAALAQVTIEGFVSNHPIRQPKTNMDGVTGSVQRLELGNYPDGKSRGGANVLRFSGPFDRVRSVDVEIQELIDTGTVVRLVTPLREYTNMLLRTYDVVRDANTGNALPFTLTAKQVRIVATEEISLPQPADPRGERRRGRGAQPAEEEDGDPGSFLANTGIFGDGIRVGG